MAQPRFVYRSDTLTAHRAFGENRPSVFGRTSNMYPTISSSVVTGALGSSLLNLDFATAASGHYVAFETLDNLDFSNDRQMSFLLRFTLGTTTGNMSLFFTGGNAGSYFPFAIGCAFNGTSFRVQIFDKLGGTIYNSNPLATTGMNTSQIYDLFLSYNGATTTSNLRMVLDASADTTVSVSPVFSTVTSSDLQKVYLGGGGNGFGDTRIQINEFCFWNEIINPMSVPLESGTTTSLNGQSRDSFVDADAFNGRAYSDPGIANVRLSSGYTLAGVSYTGSLILPATTDVKIGVNYDTGSVTGSYIASERYTDPGITNVKLNTSYLFNAATLTGSYNPTNPYSGIGDQADLVGVKDQIKVVLDGANTTTGSPIDLSQSLTTRVKRVMNVHPEMIRPQASFFPFVTCYIDNKNFENEDIAKNQLLSNRTAEVEVHVVGGVFNQNIVSVDDDPAENDIQYLMENVEQVLRSSPNLNGACLWQVPNGTDYFTSKLGEQTHVRIGVLKLRVVVTY